MAFSQESPHAISQHVPIRRVLHVLPRADLGGDHLSHWSRVEPTSLVPRVFVRRMKIRLQFTRGAAGKPGSEQQCISALAPVTGKMRRCKVLRSHR